MPCDQPLERIGAYLDGELPDAERAAFARHLAGCPACAALAGELRATTRAVRGLGREPLPTGLPERLRRSLAQASASADAAQARDATRTARPGSWPGRTVLRQAAVILVACLVSSLATWWMATGTARQDILAQDLLSAHLRALLQDSPIQVASSDAHTVKPWFAGKLEVSPEVRDLAAQGYPLIGGRLDSIGGRRVGALVYKRRLHLIDVFVWPADGAREAPATLSARNGYNLLLWTRGGVSYAAVSDLDASELGRLPELL